MKDNLIECPCCGGACYEIENAPNIKTYNCFTCGFWSNSIMKVGEKFYEEQMAVLPELYKDVAIEDKNGLVWIPISINKPENGMVYFNGTNKETAKWAAVKSIPITEEEKSKYPVRGKENQYYKYRMDMTTLKEFEKTDFSDALEYIGLV